MAWSPPAPASTSSDGPGAVAPPSPAGDDNAVARENHGVRRVEVLPGNVGLIELTLLAHFEPDEPLAGSAREVADAALALVGRAQALLIDLRDCRGGSPAMVGYLVGHFVAEDADVYNTFKSRGPDQYERPTVPIARRRLDLPLYVVVSGRTGSGAESFAYTLQAAKRATIVGEPTAGGANPGDVVDLGDGLSIFISNGSPVNPITKANWEGDGVLPDLVVAAKDAQSVAYELALEAMLGRARRGPPPTRRGGRSTPRARRGKRPPWATRIARATPVPTARASSATKTASSSTSSIAARRSGCLRSAAICSRSRAHPSRDSSSSATTRAAPRRWSCARSRARSPASRACRTARRVELRASPHRPLNAGSRFSMNARTPSLWSSVIPQRRCVIASRSRMVRKSCVSDRFTFSFM